jgi:hypothetical protein
MLGMYFADLPSERIIAEWQQPRSPGDATGPLRVVVQERDWDWSNFPYRERSYTLFLGDDYPYGQWYRFPFFYQSRNAPREIATLRVEWTHDSAVLISNAGERLSIPFRTAP